MKQLDVQLIILQREETRPVKDGQVVHVFLAADQTGSVLLNLWNELGKDISSGDIVKIHNAYTSLYRGSLRLHGSKGGRTKRIGEFTMLFNETPCMSQKVWASE